MSKHTDLKRVAIGYLESISATDIREDVGISVIIQPDTTSFIVDITARLPDGRIVAVECSVASNEAARLTILVNRFDVVYWAPVMPLLFKLDRKDLDTFSKYSTRYTCKKCKYSWQPRIPNPKVCPQCKTRSWQ